MINRTITVGSFQCNCHLICCPITGDAAVIDPGDWPDQILKLIDDQESRMQRSIQVKYLLHTHAHFDHISATGPLKKALQKKQNRSIPEIFLHKKDLLLYKLLPIQSLALLKRVPIPPSVDRFVTHEETLSIGELQLTFLHTPGHTPGSICMRLHEDSRLGSQETLFSGDTLFRSGVGRTDLPGGSFERLKKSIKNHIFHLDDETLVRPGHGPDTLVGIERRINPFVN
ncbi:MAG TPA: MBL fold metallo-hydrolase [Gammaproteobacteria bacterium]|nr:MBL fold metallo-hydrolase [Gammaproteobacteria bacterium]